MGVGFRFRKSAAFDIESFESRSKVDWGVKNLTHSLVACEVHIIPMSVLSEVPRGNGVRGNFFGRGLTKEERAELKREKTKTLIRELIGEVSPPPSLHDLVTWNGLAHCPFCRFPGVSLAVSPSGRSARCHVCGLRCNGSSWANLVNDLSEGAYRQAVRFGSREIKRAKQAVADYEAGRAKLVGPDGVARVKP